MTSQIRQLARKVVNVVAPPPPAPPKPPRNEPPVLGHRAGIDRADYGLSLEQSLGWKERFTAEVEGRQHYIFFLCGHPRSGTHWMDNVLNRHPKVMIDGEYRFESLRRATDDITGRHWHAAFREPMRSEAERCFEDTVRRVVGASCKRKPGALWLGDRTPRALNVFLKGASHFLIIRDPRDILVSWSHQELKNSGHHYTTGDFESLFGPHRAEFLKDPNFFNKNPELLLCHERWVKTLAGRWRFHLRLDLEALKRIEAGELGGGIPGRVHVVRYEKIHADPEGERRAMYAFLGVDEAEAEPLTEESRSKPGLAKEDPHHIYRKGQVGDWQRFFTPQARQWFKEQANDTLVELGYEKDANW
ncbi:MAG: sulfotransferase [Phycisphaerales bacterium]|nr:sulfotransferase [Phycisphaerales bacterium]